MEKVERAYRKLLVVRLVKAYAILVLLEHADEYMQVKDIQESLELSQPIVSHHLGELKRERLVDSYREGKCVYYRINRANYNKVAIVVKGLAA